MGVDGIQLSTAFEVSRSQMIDSYVAYLFKLIAYIITKSMITYKNGDGTLSFFDLNYTHAPHMPIVDSDIHQQLTDESESQ